MNCNARVPDGRYWVNWQTLDWGFEDGPKQGVVGDCATDDASRAAPAPEAQPTGQTCESRYRFHEDRMCYCYNMCGVF